MKTLLIVGTGGTIAGAAADPGQTVGYTYGAVSVQNLVDGRAELRGEHLRTGGQQGQVGSAWM